MLSLADIRSNYKEQILEISKEYGVANPRIFGSYARGEQDENSDLDFLFTRLPGTDLWDLGGLYSSLEKLMPVEIDVVTDDGIYEWMREEIIDEAINL